MRTCLVTQSCLTLCNPMDCNPPGSSVHEESSGKNTRVGCHFLLQEVKWSEVAQSCLTLCNPMDCSLQGSSVHGIFQARVLEWVAISFSRGSSQPGDGTHVSCIARRFLPLSHQWSPRVIIIRSYLKILATAWSPDLCSYAALPVKRLSTQDKEE